MICAACLKKLAGGTTRRGRRRADLIGVAQLLLGILTAWLFFYCMGRGLLETPDSFHEGTVWENDFMDEE